MDMKYYTERLKVRQQKEIINYIMFTIVLIIGAVFLLGNRIISSNTAYLLKNALFCITCLLVVVNIRII